MPRVKITKKPSKYSRVPQNDELGEQVMDMGGILGPAIPIRDINTFSNQAYGGEVDSRNFMYPFQTEKTMKKGGHWIQGAVNPAHKGYCSPMTKSTCTGKRRAFALTMKKHHGFHEDGGYSGNSQSLVGNITNPKYYPSFKKGGKIHGAGPNADLNPTTNHSIADYNPYIYWKNKNWYMTTNPTDNDITQSMKPVDEDVANIEAEKGELLVKPDLMGLYNITGKTHANGGTPLYAEGGSFIFSNDPKLSVSKKEREVFGFKEGGSTSKSNNTPAKVLNREIKPKDYNSYIATLQENSSDKIAKTTAALMLEKMQNKIGRMAYLQEAKKNKPIPEFAMGSAPLQKGQFNDIDEKMDEYAYGGMYQDGGDSPFPGYYLPQDPGKPGKRGANKHLPFPGYYLPGQDQGAPTGNSPRGYATNPNDIWRGDRNSTPNPQTGAMSNTWNAMTHYKSPQEYADAVGYTGTDMRPDAIQNWVMQTYPDLVNKYHAAPPTGYGMPKAGKPVDRKLGVRWESIADELYNNPKLPQFPQQSFLAPPEDQPQAGPNHPIVSSPQQPAGVPPNQPFDSTPSLPYNIQGKLTPMQLADLTRIGLQSMNINRYYPKRQQINLPEVSLNQISAQPQVNAINNQSFQAIQAANLNPRTASLIASNIRGAASDQLSGVLGNVANRNVEIGNQQNMINLQQRSRQVEANNAYDQDYYNKVQATNQNYDDEKRFANNQFFSTLNQYKSQDDALAWQLAAQSRYGNRKVRDPKTGRIYNQPTPLFEYDPNGGIRYNADVANINMAPAGTKIDTPTEIAAAYRELLSATGDKTIAQRILNQVLRSKGVKGAQSQGPFYTMQNPYSGNY